MISEYKEGYLICVFGKSDNYYKMASRLIRNIREYDNFRPICILTDNVNNYSYPEDVIIKIFDLETHLHKNIDSNIDWHKYGLYPKIFQSYYTPFQHTMFLDADMIFRKDFTHFWDIYYKSNQTILIPGLSDENNRSPANWHWNNINNVMIRSGLNIPQTFTTLMIYNKKFSKIIEEKIIYIFDNLQDMKVLPYYCSGYPDEIMYSILLGILNYKISIEMHDWLLNIENCDPTNKNV